MDLHEYQGQEILACHGVRVPMSMVVETPEEALCAAREITKLTGANKWVVKAQIHAGGRGKGGGVKLASSLNEVRLLADKILGMQLVTHQTVAEGKRVNKVLIVQNVFYPGDFDIQEFYMSILLNRNTGKPIVMYSTEGGVDVEKVAEDSPHLIFKEEVDVRYGILPFQIRRIAFNLGLSGKAFNEMCQFVTSLYKTYIKADASLIEINPVLKTSDNLIMAIDTKLVLDDNALFRHPELLNMRDVTEEAPQEIEASEYNLNFIKLDGNVGCMVNGAGLAMATMDVIKLSGGEPANFLDVGGAASEQSVKEGLKIILRDGNVKVVLINIFGGIVRCDRVAKGIVDAYKEMGGLNVPVIARLQGTNAEEGKDIIDGAGLIVHSVITMKEAACLVKQLI